MIKTGFQHHGQRHQEAPGFVNEDYSHLACLHWQKIQLISHFLVIRLFKQSCRHHVVASPDSGMGNQINAQIASVHVWLSI